LYIALKTLPGGDCGDVKDQLVDVEILQATETAFAALRKDGRCLTWGAAMSGPTEDVGEGNPKNTSLSVDLSFCLNFSGGEGMTDDGFFFRMAQTMNIWNNSSPLLTN